MNRVVTLAIAGIISCTAWGQNVSTYAGSPQGSTNPIVNSPSSLKLQNPVGIAFDGMGRMWSSEEMGHVIRLFYTDGKVYARSGTPGAAGYANGSGPIARYTMPAHIAIDANGNIYVADAGNHVIRKIDAFSSLGNAQLTNTLAGNGNQGHNDGPGSNAQFHTPYGIAVDNNGNVYVADKGSHVIRKITPAGNVTTLAGQPNQAGNADGSGNAAKFNYPVDIIHSGGDLYVADSWNRAIRKITTSGQVTTVTTLSGGLLLQAIERDGSGNFYAAIDCRIFKYDGTNATLLAGGQFGNDCGHIDGPTTTAKFNKIYDLELEGSYLYVVERQENSDSDYVRRINLVTTTVETLPLSQKVTIYPNPASDQVHILLPTHIDNAHYEIWNIFGKQMDRGPLPNTNTRVDLSDFTPGIYFLKIYGNDQQLLLKLRVQ